MKDEVGGIPLLGFEHLPQLLYENIAEIPQGKEFLSLIRQLSLEKSVPLMMQVLLNASIQEIADYHKITRQAVYKRNKSSLMKLKSYTKCG